MPNQTVLNVIALKREFIESKIAILQMRKTVLLEKISTLDEKAARHRRNDSGSGDIIRQNILVGWDKWREQMQTRLQTEIAELDKQRPELAAELMAIVAQHEAISLQQGAVRMAEQEEKAEQDAEQGVSIWSLNRGKYF